MKYKDFYSKQYQEDKYCTTIDMVQHSFYKDLEAFLQRNPRYRKGKCLEIGSGRGALQDIVDDYTGVDVSDAVGKYYHKPVVPGCDARQLPFEDNTFDLVWSYAVWEHIPNPQKAFEETIRVIKNGGVFLLRPAWNCRPWAADGYSVRPYSDFNILGKIYKFFIPLLDSKIYRAAYILPKRLFYSVLYKTFGRNHKLIYKKLKANYEFFWESDSDACNSLDPYLVMLWFESMGCKILSHKGIRKLLITHDPVEIMIIK